MIAYTRSTQSFDTLTMFNSAYATYWNILKEMPSVVGAEGMVWVYFLKNL